MVIYFVVFLLAVIILAWLYQRATNVYLNQRFFILGGGVVIMFVVSYFLNDTDFFRAINIDPIIFAWTSLGVLVTMSIVDALILFSVKRPFRIERKLPKVLSLGDSSKIQVLVQNLTSQKLNVEVIDELPVEFQVRDFNVKFPLVSLEEKKINYELRPLQRGEYEFGSTYVFMSSVLGLLQRRYVHPFPSKLPVYPSLIQMKNFELKAFDKVTMDKGGVKKMRRIGHSYEFEQIKDYVRGDDYRSINWKATSRSNKLMVNQYQDERSQQVYCMIDKSRNMKMPFNGLSLMDYAVNTSLVVSNIALRKHDRAGLLTFSNIIGTTVKADRKPSQLNAILQALYIEKERNLEANYELLYRAVRNLISGRSLIFLFTNFESQYAMERVLPILRRINNQHLLVLVFFDNTEIRTFAEQPVQTVKEMYHKTIAENHIYDKEQIAAKLQQYGIQTILTTPTDLSMSTVNKYLELKSRGLI